MSKNSSASHVPSLSVDRPLRVGLLAPISWRLPPRHYGPWEQVAALLAEGLVRRGVDVTVFATADSITSGRLVGVCPRPYSEDPSLDAKAWECLHISEAFERAAAGEFDVLHNHFDFLPLSYSGLVPRVPVVTTIHGFSSERILPVFEKYSGRPNIHYVAISDADRHPRLRYSATIHHGIALDAFPLRSQPDSPAYLLFFGRIHPDKGALEAIELAERAGIPLRLAGIVQDERYFREKIEPRLRPGRVDYLGSVGPDRRAEILGGAVALLHLINFDEPFGLSVVESMACGTPVLARSRGSMKEIVEPGVNGCLVADDADAADLMAALDKTRLLDRHAVRRSVQERFGVERMVDDYLALYRRITNG